MQSFGQMWISFGQSKDNQKIKAIADLGERLDTIERTLRSLDLEFSTLYGKVRQALGRIDKRAAIIEKQNASSEGSEAQDAESSDLEPASFGEPLTKRQLQLNQQILAARRRI